MIDSTYTIKPKTQRKFVPLPADKYQVQITDINIVMQANPFKGGEEEERLNFEFTVLDNKTMDSINDDGEQEIESVRGRRLWKRIAPSNSPAGKKSKASWFYKLLCAVERKELGEDLTEIAPATLIGQQLIVMVEVAGEYNNVLSFAPITKELEAVPNADERAKEEQTENVDPEELETKLPAETKVEDVKGKELDELFAKE